MVTKIKQKSRQSYHNTTKLKTIIYKLECFDGVQAATLNSSHEINVPLVPHCCMKKYPIKKCFLHIKNNCTPIIINLLMVHSLLVLRTLVLIPLTLFEKKRIFSLEIWDSITSWWFFAKKKKTGVNVALCILVVGQLLYKKKTHVYIIL